MSQLKGKVALVTGGSRGIGAAAAIRLAEEGVDVAVTYASGAEKAQRVVRAIEAKGRRGLAIAADSRDAAAVEGAVRRTVEALGRLDILVANAGIFVSGSVDAFTLPQFDETIAVNLRAPFIASKAAAAAMRDGGRIILIGSNLAERVAGPGMAGYAASKAGLIGLARGLARDLGSRAITVNVVQPGPTDTDMNPAAGPHAEPQRSLMAIPRFGAADDVASLVAWLAGPHAHLVTGAALTIDGGTNA